MSLDSIKVDLSGQTAIVTGASQGLGRCMAIALARSARKSLALLATKKNSMRP